MVLEQRAGLAALLESEQSGRLMVLGMERAQLVQAEALARQTIAEEQARSLDVSGAMQGLVQAAVAATSAAEREIRAASASAAAAAAAMAETLAGFAQQAAMAVAAEAEQRLALVDEEQWAMSELRERHAEGVQAGHLVAEASAALELAETAVRMTVAEEQAMGTVALLSEERALSASLAARLAEAQAAARASRARCEALEAALEEQALALAGVGREVEALRDSQAAAGPEAAEAQQRELARSEAERREVVALGKRHPLRGLGF